METGKLLEPGGDLVWHLGGEHLAVAPSMAKRPAQQLHTGSTRKHTTGTRNEQNTDLLKKANETYHMSWAMAERTDRGKPSLEEPRMSGHVGTHSTL
jgi:hypothetical protein